MGLVLLCFGPPKKYVFEYGDALYCDRFLGCYIIQSSRNKDKVEVLLIATSLPAESIL